MTLLLIFVFVLGLVVGSFLNAVIYRLENGDNVFRGRSYCPHCKHTLAWHDLIPLASFVMLGGKCRYCKGKISWQYPSVEISTALVFLLILKSQVFLLRPFDFAQGFGGQASFEILNLLYPWTIASLLIVLFVYDLKHYILPDKVLFPAIGIVLLYRVFEVWGLVRQPADWDLGFVVSGFAAALFFFAIFAISRGRAMGFGDVKLSFFMGLFLGWPNILVALCAAFFAGAVVGVGLILLKKKGMRSEIPFGPFLIGGTFAALFAGEQAVDWCLDLVMI